MKSKGRWGIFIPEWLLNQRKIFVDKVTKDIEKLKEKTPITGEWLKLDINPKKKKEIKMGKENSFYTDGPTYKLNECFLFQVSFIPVLNCSLTRENRTRPNWWSLKYHLFWRIIICCKLYKKCVISVHNGYHYAFSNTSQSFKFDQIPWKFNNQMLKIALP